ncbi:MAG: polysaccharide biosynthesis/export family protein [Ferruginibacter sp.]
MRKFTAVLWYARLILMFAGIYFFLKICMHHFFRVSWYFLLSVFLIASFTSCISTKKVAYFNDVKDSALIASNSGLEPVIQKKDILSISVTSLSTEATVLFNMPNLPVTPTQATNNTFQTAGYLVSEDGTIKFPILGNISAAGLSQKQLENTITQLLIDKKLLFDPIVTSRFLNFRVTVLGEVLRPGVVYVPSEQISILEAIGQAGDLTIYGLRDNVILIRQEGGEKLVKRLNLNSSQILKSPYFFLKSNDVLYVQPGKEKIASINRTQQLLPVVLSGLSLIIIILTNVFK